MDTQDLQKAIDLLDPYGILEYVVGDGNNFVCFDYLITGANNPRGIFGMALVIKAVINCENFIQEFGLWNCDFDDSPYVTARNAIGEAIDWCVSNNVKHDKSGWNQTPHYLTRSIFQEYDKHTYADGPAVPRITERQIRMGGKRINRCIGII